MENNKNFLKNFFENLKQNRKIQIIAIFVLISLALLILFQSYTSKDYSVVNDTAIAYVKNLEQRLEKVLSKVEGAGNVSVVITIESGMETVLAMTTTTKETTNGTTIEQAPLIINGKTVVVKENFPPISGVLVVCQGANNIRVLTKIQQATLSLLDIELGQIEILSMK